MFVVCFCLLKQKKTLCTIVENDILTYEVHDIETVEDDEGMDQQLRHHDREREITLLRGERSCRGLVLGA